MKFRKISDEFVSSGRSQFIFQMDGDSRIITLVGKEWRYSSSGIRSIVVRGFHQREKGAPVILLIVGENMDVLFQGLVDMFCLSVAFWVVTRSEMEFHVQGFAE